MKEAIGVGTTPELALQDACRQLGVESYDVQYELLEMPEKKILGLFGGRPAKVRAFIEDASPAQAAADYLKKILDGLGAKDIEVTIEEKDGGAELTISGEDAGIVIGHHGETLSALQYLVGLVANHVQESYYRITLNTGNYREKREQTLQQLGHRMAAKAVATGRRQMLEPMNPYERRIIHTAVQEVEGATSWSEGMNMDRHVVVGSADGGKAPRPARPGMGSGASRRPNGKRPYNSNSNNTRRGSRPYNNNHAPYAAAPAVTGAEAAAESVKAEKAEKTPMNPVKDIAPVISNVIPAETARPAEVPTASPITPVTPAVPAKKAETGKVPLYGRIEVKKDS